MKIIMSLIVAVAMILTLTVTIMKGDILTTIIREEGAGDSHEDQKEDSLRFNRANIEITEELIIKMMICL